MILFDGSLQSNIFWIYTNPNDTIFLKNSLQEQVNNLLLPYKYLI